MMRWYRCDIQKVNSRVWLAFIRELDVLVSGETEDGLKILVPKRIEALTGDSNPTIVWVEV